MVCVRLHLFAIGGRTEVRPSVLLASVFSLWRNATGDGLFAEKLLANLTGCDPQARSENVGKPADGEVRESLQIEAVLLPALKGSLAKSGDLLELPLRQKCASPEDA